MTLDNNTSIFLVHGIWKELNKLIQEKKEKGLVWQCMPLLLAEVHEN